LVLAAILSPFL
jgi:hypothetical protein